MDAEKIQFVALRKKLESIRTSAPVKWSVATATSASIPACSGESEPCSLLGKCLKKPLRSLADLRI